MKNLFFSLICIVIATTGNSQIVSTILNSASQKVDDALIIDAHGNLYGSHYNGSNVYKITPSGTVSIFAGGFNTPNGLAFDSQNNLFVCDNIANRIYKLSETGIFLDTINILKPSGIIKQPNSDTMIVAQYQTNLLSQVAPDKTIIDLHSGTPLNGPVGLAYDSHGKLFLGNFIGRKIYSYDSAGLTYVATIPGSASWWLGFITYANGSIWATGFQDNKIYRVNPNFVDSVSIFAGSMIGNIDGAIDSARFNNPNGITASITGDTLFISDYNSGRVRMISGMLSTGISEQHSRNSNIIIYPNPAKDFIYISSDQQIDKVYIYDLAGNMQVISDKSHINIEKLISAEYLVKVLLKDKSEVRRILVLD
ncbi:MAG TPA: T9SS type A sorting domain-containing protein [Bacteroidia bacterium]|nr:T9SS type A sorting domain-containing protein [Bacteroidia bacterium]